MFEYITSTLIRNKTTLFCPTSTIDHFGVVFWESSG